MFQVFNFFSNIQGLPPIKVELAYIVSLRKCKPQVCVVSTVQVHIPSRYTHTKCSPFWSDVPTGSNPVSGLIFHTFFKVLFVESNLELNISKFNLDFQIYKVTKLSHFKYSIIISKPNEG